MRYEVWVRSGDQDEVRVYASDVEGECRVVFDGNETYHFTMTPVLANDPAADIAREITGYEAQATYYTSDKGKPIKVLDKKGDL